MPYANNPTPPALTPAQAQEVRQRLSHGATLREVANAFGVSRQTVHRIRWGSTAGYALAEEETPVMTRRLCRDCGKPVRASTKDGTTRRARCWHCRNGRQPKGRS